MEYKKGDIDGVKIIPLKKNTDKRGFLIETFRIDTLPENIQPEMSYASYTKPGVSRGPHEHKYQTDIFSFIGPGDFRIKLWDNRKDSKTYRNFMEIHAGEKNPATIIVPPGVIHGYKNISKDSDAMVLNYPDKLYKGRDKKEEVDEIRHEDVTDSVFKI